MLHNRQRVRGSAKSEDSHERVESQPLVYDKMQKRVKAGIDWNNNKIMLPLCFFAGLGVASVIFYFNVYHEEAPKVDNYSPICINDPSKMPEYWKPPPDLFFQDSGLPWSEEERAMAMEATQTGLNELLNYYAHNMTTKKILKLGTDAVNSLIDECYATHHMPEFHAKALRAASDMLQLSAKKFVSDENTGECKSTYKQLKFVGYGQYLTNSLPTDLNLRHFQDKLVAKVNLMIEICGTIEEMLDIGEVSTLFENPETGDPDVDVDVIFDYVLTAIGLTECLTVPGLRMPKGTEEFIAGLWTYLSNDYKMPYARNHPRHYHHSQTRDVSWVATHIAYIPTGYGRHQQFIADAPWLYQYIRENFYYALEYGMLDLICEFIDLVRQYGCTEDNDYQVRHGTRYVLSLYEKAGHSWMNYREDYQQDGREISDYDMIHKPWTSISGVIGRSFEPIVPGSYGHVFLEVIKRQAKNEDVKEQMKMKRLRKEMLQQQRDRRKE